MEYLANKLTNQLAKWQIVKEEDKELYAYGFWQGAVFILNIITVVVAGVFFQMLWQSLIFMVAYGLIRSMAGGYHARTQRSCYILSIALIVSVLAILKWVSWSVLACLILLASSVCSVFLWAPVEDRNKPLDEIEQYVYKKRSRIIAVFLFVTAILFITINQVEIASCISVSVAASAIMLIFGKISNYTYNQG
ncbi:MAG: accessory gene regulator B family protein [Lachnospiraceae bacterium]|nr:accessory gene regulator B family protein [Lachnospiraceae bacterium]